MDVYSRIYKAPAEARKRRKRQVSTTVDYELKLLKYKSNSEAMDRLKNAINHLINKDDRYLENNFYDHPLRDNLTGYRTFALYPHEYGDRDILVLYRIFKNDNATLYTIGNHKHVYEDYNPKRKYPS